MLDGEGRFADEDVGAWLFVPGVVVPYLVACGQFCARIKRASVAIKKVS